MTNLFSLIFYNLPAIVTTVFLLIIISYYILIFANFRKPKATKKFSSLTVIIPAHNEERYMAECIKSVIKAEFKGKKKIIVIDDGSIDNTYQIASKFKSSYIKVMQTPHSGKASSINKAISKTNSELIAIVDADSTIRKDALRLMSDEIAREETAACTGIVRVKNRRKFICMWLHIEQAYNSLIRLLFSKINANIVTPGPLSIYRRKELLKVGGFSTRGFSEDIDISIRLIRSGYKIGFSEKAISDTNMPYKAKGFLMQRTRFAKGMLNIFRKHVQLNSTIIDVYTLPLFMFFYVQAIIMGSFTIYQIVSGYITHFLAKDIIFSMTVLKFFFEWFSIIGFARWSVGVFTGQTPLTLITIVGIVSTLLTYPLYLLAIIKFDRKFDLRHAIPLFFMFPFWLLIMVIYTLMIPEIFKRKQTNVWKKNE
jgi:cellulose synthase/poly-beta-1,6-N-acetylglucosamine synthase-like glycosyltransferase